MRKDSYRSRLLTAGVAALLAGALGLATSGAQEALAGPRVLLSTERYLPYGAIAWTGSIAMITEAGDNGDLYFWWNRGGDTSWHQEVVANGSSSVQFSDPAIAWTGAHDTSNPSVVITAMGYDPATNTRQLYFWWQAFGVKAWHEQVVAKGDYRGPSIAVTSTSVVIAAAYAGGTGLAYWYQPFHTTRWHEQGISHGEYLSASIGWTGSAVVLAALNAAPRAQLGNIVLWRNLGGDTTWHRQMVAAETSDVSFDVPSLAVAKNSVIIAAADNGFNIYFWSQKFGASTWHQEIAASSPIGFGTPSIAWAGNRISIAVPGIGAVGGLFLYYHHPGTKGWHKQTVAPSGNFVYEGASITGTQDATVIAGLDNPGDNPGDVDYFSQAYGTTPWNEQTVASKCC